MKFAKMQMAHGAILAGMLLSGCDRKPEPPKNAPRPQHVDMSKFKVTAETNRLMSRAAWDRPGSWKSIEVMGDRGPTGAFYAVDRFGSRILTTMPISGYAITRVMPNCTRNTLAVTGTLISDKDAGKLDASKHEKLNLMVRPDQIKAMCATSETGGQQTIANAVVRLRNSQADYDAKVTGGAHGRTIIRKDEKTSAQIDTEGLKKATQVGRPTAVSNTYPGMPTNRKVESKAK